MDFQDLLKSKLVTFSLLIALALVMFVTARILIQKYEVQKEIDKLKTRAAEVERKNQELAELIKYLDTPQYAERQAREKLNLRKEDELVVVLPESENEELSSQDSNAQTESNPRKWFSYFFDKKK